MQVIAAASGFHCKPAAGMPCQTLTLRLRTSSKLRIKSSVACIIAPLAVPGRLPPNIRLTWRDRIAEQDLKRIDCGDYFARKYTENRLEVIRPDSACSPLFPDCVYELRQRGLFFG